MSSSLAVFPGCGSPLCVGMVPNICLIKVKLQPPSPCRTVLRALHTSLSCDTELGSMFRSLHAVHHLPESPGGYSPTSGGM